MLSSLSFFFSPCVRFFPPCLSFFLFSIPFYFLLHHVQFISFPLFCFLYTFFLSSILFKFVYSVLWINDSGCFWFFFSSPSVHQYMKPVLIPGVEHSLKYSIIQKYNTKKIKGGVGGNSEKHTSTCMMILKCYHHSSLRNRLPQECLG